MTFNKDDLSDGGAVAQHVQAQLPLWAKVAPASIHVKDFSASGGARVYKVWHDGDVAVTPAAVILKAEGDTEVDVAELSLQSRTLADEEFNIQDARSEAVAKVLEQHDLAPPCLATDPDGAWHIELFGGGGCSKDFNHFDPEIAPIDALAKLMAAFHATPTDWFEPFRAQMVSQWPVLQGLPVDAPFWNGAAFGWENGALFTGGKMDPQKHLAQLKIFSLMGETGVMKQLISSTCLYPTSALAKRVVTIHGDFKPNNLIKRSDKDGCMCIDYDFTHVSCAQQELSFAFSKWLGPKFQPAAVRYQFLEAYVAAAGAAGLSADKAALDAAMLDIEIGTICNFDGLLFSGLSRQVPCLRGVAHPTPVGGKDDGSATPSGPELLAALDAFIASVRASAALSVAAIEEGIVVLMYKTATGPLKAWLDEMRALGSLGAFGIYADEATHKKMQEEKGVITPWIPLA